MKKLLALLMAIAMLVSIVACGGGSKEKDNVVDTNNPILNATANLLNKLASEGGTITLSVEGDAMDMIEQQFGLSFESLVFATDTKQVQATLNGKIGNTKLSESIYYGNQNLVVNAPSILGGAYGINLGSFDKDFANSIFNPESNSDFAIDEETMAQIEEVITSLKQVMSGEATESIPGLDTEAMAATITKVAETLMAEIEKIYPTETTKKDGYTTQTITITDDKISEVFEVVAKLLEDKEVKGLLETIGETLKEYTKSEIPFDQLPTMLRQLGAQIDQLSSQMEVTCVASVKTDKKGLDNEISMKLTLDYAGKKGSIGFTVLDKTTDTNEKFVHTVSLSFDLEGVFEDLLEGAFSSSDEKETADRVYPVTSANSPVAESTVPSEIFSLIEGGMKITTEWNKKSGDLDVSLEMGENKLFALESNLKISGNEMTFVFEKLEVAGMFDTSEYIDNVTLKISAGKPKGLGAPNFKNVLKLTEGDMVDLAGVLQETLKNLGLGGKTEETEDKNNVLVDTIPGYKG